MQRYEIILWDVDQTLLDFTRSEDYALRNTFEQFGRQIDSETVALYSGINDSYWKRLERGEVTKQEVLLGRFYTLFERLSIEDIDVREFASAYQKALGSVYFYRDDSYRLCLKLKKDYRQYVVTNGVTWTQRNKLRLSGFDKIMDDIFISEEIGSPKPYLEFFEKCFNRIPDFDREKTIIVGDSLTSDMLGGNRAKISCCWYNPEGKVRTDELNIDFQIKNLWEIKKILEKR
ncbi:MAG: YjjG family noncanonical pyrimidine nucleotidase [Lachnospiraceae bacterium]|nr:YjjG family noncanonical pyrimidine nucleotidase [Lachnospiraceae bacterium]MDD7628176.1 YjjG family noncanonical pyrimidine nucleotidase [Lachnospiraceae bacterium]MDY4118165.1 YjjG family noncanonical pyrimidine nucleotidase [Lachnospiraceae bacterium]